MISYNPGYQSVPEGFEESTKQRFGAIDLIIPPPDVETKIVAHEARIASSAARTLVEIGIRSRNLRRSRA